MTATSIKQEGDSLYKQARYQDAVEKYTIAIDKCSNPAASDIHLAYSNRSACYMHLGMQEKALDDANICIALKPTWPKGYGRKGACLTALNRVQQAIECYEKVLQLDSSNVEATASISRLSRAQGNHTNNPNSSFSGEQAPGNTFSFDWRKTLNYLMTAITSAYYRCMTWWQDLSPDVKLYTQIGAAALFLYIIFFRPFSSTDYDYDSGYGYGSGYGYSNNYGGGMSWTMWGLIMGAAYKIPPMLPDLLGEQYARPFFGMSWTTFMWLLQMFSRNTAGMGGFGRGGFGRMPGGGMFGNRRRY